MLLVFYFQFFCGIYHQKKKKKVWLCYLYSIFIFNIHKIRFEYKNWLNILGVFNFMSPTNSELSHKKLSLFLSLSLSLSMDLNFFLSEVQSDPWSMLTASWFLLCGVCFGVCLQIGLLKWLWRLFVLRHIWWWIWGF